MQHVGHKHFMSERTGRNFPLSTCSHTCSLPLLFMCLLGKEGDKAKTALSAEPLRSSPISGPLPPTSPGPDPKQLLPPNPWHGGVGRPRSRGPGCIGPKALSPLGQALPLRSPGLRVPRPFTQTSRKEKNKIFVGNCS